MQRRFNAPLDPRAELAGIIPAPVLATLSDTDARLFYHYIDVQATISVGVETEDNPLSTYFIPVALSAALGESNGDSGPNDGNPAFHALKACAATHRANLMDGTGTDGSAAFRQVAQSARKRAYALLAERIEVLSRASPLEREQFAGALAIVRLQSGNVLTLSSSPLPWWTETRASFPAFFKPTPCGSRQQTHQAPTSSSSSARSACTRRGTTSISS